MADLSALIREIDFIAGRDETVVRRRGLKNRPFAQAQPPLMDLPPIVQRHLKLEDPTCLAWLERMMLHLSRGLEPENAKWWCWGHISLRNRAPAYLLPDGWTPACTEACLLEAYVFRGTELFRGRSAFP